MSTVASDSSAFSLSAGDIDWAADDAAGINTRARMEYGKVYRRVGTTCCSRCGVNSAQRSDLAAVLIQGGGDQGAMGPALCPEHLERWLKHRDGFTQAGHAVYADRVCTPLCSPSGSGFNKLFPILDPALDV